MTQCTVIYSLIYSDVDLLSENVLNLKYMAVVTKRHNKCRMYTDKADLSPATFALCAPSSILYDIII